MKKERYKANSPKHLVIGDPWYFETKKGEELQRLIVDYRPSENFKAGIMLSEQEAFGIEQRNITMFFAPDEHLTVYMDDMIYEGQETKSREIPVDTARYYMDVDGRKENIYTACEGYWGQVIDYYHKEKDRIFLDAVIVSMAMPEEIEFEQMRQMMEHLFEGIKPIKEKQVKQPDRQR